MWRTAQAASLALCACLVIAGCSSTSEPSTAGSATTTVTSAPTGSSALKPIDPAAVHKVVEATAKGLMVPGAMVILRTPQGNYEAAYGTAQLRPQTPPTGDHPFRD